MTANDHDSMETLSDPSGRVAIPLKEAARRLSIGRNSAYAAALSGEIPTIRIGKKILVPIRALEELLNSAGSSSKREA